MNTRQIAAIAALTLGSTLVAAPAFATGNGHQDKVWVCHVPPGNPDNPRLIHVGAASTQLEGHRSHELDTIGDGAQAACATSVTVTPTETSTVTAPPVTVTETVTAPPVTETTTVTAPPVEETAVIPGPTHTVEVPGPEEVVVVTAPPVTKTKEVAGPVVTSTVTNPAVTETELISSAKAVQVRSGKELAYTGFDIGITSLGVLLLGAGVLLTALSRRVRNH